MSITAQLRQLTAAEAQEIERDPATAYALLQKAFDAKFGWGLTMMQKMEEINARYAEVIERRRAVKELKELSEQDQQLLEKWKAEYRALQEQYIDEKGQPRMKKAPRGPRELDLQKAWHGLHFVLTGLPEGGKPPLANAILGGRELPDQDKIMGYGPARYLTPDQVREVSLALQQISEKDVVRRFNLDAARAAGIYALDQPEDLEYLKFHLRKLKAYYKSAAARGNAMLLYFI